MIELYEEIGNKPTQNEMREGDVDHHMDEQEMRRSSDEKRNEDGFWQGSYYESLCYLR